MTSLGDSCLQAVAAKHFHGRMWPELRALVQDLHAVVAGLEKIVAAAEAAETQGSVCVNRHAADVTLGTQTRGGRRAGPGTVVTVTTLGPLTVKVGGELMSDEHWRAGHAGPVNARALFAFLVHTRQTPLTHDEIADAVWPFKEDGFPAIFSRTLSGLRQAFRLAGLPVNPVVAEGGRYSLNQAIEWQVDAEQVSECFSRAESRRAREGLAKAAPLYREVIAGMRGAYMESIASETTGKSGTGEAQWWQGKRGHFEDIHARTAVRLATHSVNEGQPVEALSLWEQEMERPVLDTYLLDVLAPVAARAYLASSNGSVGLAVMARLHRRVMSELEEELPGLVKAISMLRRPTGPLEETPKTFAEASAKRPVLHWAHQQNR